MPPQDFGVSSPSSAGGMPTAHASTHGSGAGDAVSLSAAQVTAGTLALARGGLNADLSNVAQNRVLASPDGSAGGVSSRALVSGDIPNLDAAKVTTGTLALARGGLNADLSNVAQNLVAASPIAAPGPVALRALEGADLPTVPLAKVHSYARMIYLESFVTGTIPTTKYAAPGTVQEGLAAPARLINFKVAGLSTGSTWVLQGIYADLETAPGGTDSLTVTVMKSADGAAFADTAATCTITGAAKSGSDEAHNISFDNDDALAAKIIGGGAAADLHLTIVLLRTA